MDITAMARLELPKRHQEYLDYTLTYPPAGRSDVLVIYAHGFASNQQGEKVRFFRERFNAVGCAFLAFDHRGHGQSSGTMKELTVTRNLEDLDAVITHLGTGYTRRVVIGSSMGGQTAAWYAATHPDRISANLLIAPGFRFLQNRLRDLGPEGLERLRTTGEYTIRNQWVEVTIGRALLQDAERYVLEGLLPHYCTPALILHGTADDSVPFQDSVDFVRLAKARPLELLLIAGGDHRLTQHLDTLFATMQAFLSGLGLLP